MELIQGIVNRMASSSVAVKGFAATIFAGILAIVISSGIEHQILALLIAAIIILVSAVFDGYYFLLEKKYRRMFDEVRVGDRQCNFDLKPQKYDDIKPILVIKSWVLWCYYGLLEILILAAMICITKGIL